jgi:long-chain acyl-CoA synthetase
MGSGQSRPPISELAEGEIDGPFAVRRCPGFGSQILQNPPELQTMQDMVTEMFSAHAARTYLGRRLFINGEFEKKFTFITYAEAESISRDLGSGLWHEPFNLGPQGLVGIWSENRIEWIHLINTSGLYGQTIVSLYDTFGDEALSGLVNLSRISLILVSSRFIPRIITLLSRGKFEVRYIIGLIENDTPIEDPTAQFEALGIQYRTWAQLLKLGHDDRRDLPKLEPEWLHYICFSSGTTGLPKGVMISHRSMVSNTLNHVLCLNVDITSVHLSYLPLPHVFERSAIAVCSYVGARLCPLTHSIPHLMEDMQLLHPTHMTTVPRVVTRVYDNVMDTLRKSSFLTRATFWGFWYWKRFWIERGSTSHLADRLVFHRVNEQLGGKMTMIVCGGAAMDRWVHEFIQVATSIPLRVGYGLSEIGTGDIVNPQNAQWSKPGTIGGPEPNIEVRLEPLEDYDDPHCGELLCGGQGLCSGYLHDEDATEQLFVNKERTWIRTGDIAKWDSDGYMMIVDRIRSVFKLAQGEYVAAELLTLTYELATLVAQIFVYGDAKREWLVAIVVPDRQQAEGKFGITPGNEEEYARLCRGAELNAAIKQQLDELARDRKFPGYQRIRTLACEPEPWTIASDFLTPTFKLKRKKLTEKYRTLIEELYARK